MYLNESLEEITILLILLCNDEILLLINELVLIEEGIGNDGHIELLVLLVLHVLILVIILVVYFQEAERV
jgi:hypothetical protein